MPVCLLPIVRPGTMFSLDEWRTPQPMWCVRDIKLGHPLPVLLGPVVKVTCSLFVLQGWAGVRRALSCSSLQTPCPFSIPGPVSALPLFLGPLFDSDQCGPGTSHKGCSLGAALKLLHFIYPLYLCNTHFWLNQLWPTRKKQRNTWNVSTPPDEKVFFGCWSDEHIQITYSTLKHLTL